MVIDMDKVITVAAIQVTPPKEGGSNLARVRELIALASERGARIVSLPALFNSHWFPYKIDDSQLPGGAEEEDGETVTFLKEVASETGVMIVAPIAERDGGKYYNTAFLIGSGGEVVGKYRKVHVPQIPLWEERSYFTPGDDLPVFDTPYGKIGILICWDIFFPEAFRVLALKGADIVFTPTASAFRHSYRKWERAIGAAAHANGLYIVRVNRIGKEAKQDFYGRSFCVRPDGDFVDEPAGEQEGIVLADIDIGEAANIRKEWVFMGDRRPEIYGDITK